MKDKQQTWDKRRLALHGRKVRIKRRIRTIIGTYADIDGGIILNKPVEELRSWNIEDVTLLPEPPTP